MLGPAGKLVEILSNVDYSGEEFIYSLHCTKTNECPVYITTISNSEMMFPEGSFVRGAVYHIYLKKAIFKLGKAGFIGYILLNEK